MEEIKYIARAEYSGGNALTPEPFRNEAAADQWATAQIRKDPGAIVVVQETATGKVHNTYRAQDIDALTAAIMNNIARMPLGRLRQLYVVSRVMAQAPVKAFERSLERTNAQSRGTNPPPLQPQEKKQR